MIEPILIKAGSSLLKLGIHEQSPKVDCRVVSEITYQRLKSNSDKYVEIKELIKKS